MWLLLFLTTVFSILSTGLMSLIVMHMPLGPWVGPLFVVVCMAIIIPFVSRKWFQHHAIITIASSSIGGMIGLALGRTLPSFYFLYKEQFLQWVDQPLLFIGTIVAVVICAGGLAFFIAYLIKDYLILDEKLPFPMSKVVYNIVSVDRYDQVHTMMWAGIGISSVWNIVIMGIKFVFHRSMATYHMMPMLLSIGFVAGDLNVVPMTIGLVNRTILFWLRDHYFATMHKKEFLVLFCLGMLSVQIVNTVAKIIFKHFMHVTYALHGIKLHVITTRSVVCFTTVLLPSSVVLYLFGITWLQQLFIIPLLFLIGFNIAKIIGQIGIVSIDGFLWCVLLVMMYFFTALSSINFLFIAVFASICLCVVIDLSFSYKLASLASITYRRLLPYQLVGFVVAAIASGCIMWYYAQSFDVQSLHHFAPDARDLDAVINFGTFNYKVFVCGIVSGLIMIATGQRLLVVIGSTFISAVESLLLIVAGIFAHFMPKRERYFPLCFGMYAAHVIWMIVWAGVFHHVF